MKFVILFTAALVGSALSQIATKPATSARRSTPTKRIETTKANNCQQLSQTPPTLCCPSFKDVASREAACNNACAKNTSVSCCVANCMVGNLQSAVTNKNARSSSKLYFSSLAKNRTAVQSLISNMKNCVAKGAADNKQCPAEGAYRCLTRLLFMNCPDKVINDKCNKTYAAANTCPDYPNKSTENGRNNQRQNGTSNNIRPNGAVNSSNPSRPPAKNAPRNRAVNSSTIATTQKRRAKAVAATTKPYTGPPTTHPSLTGNGALGEKGPTFKDK